MDGVGGYEGWRWIFILEGILTVLVACIAFFTIYDFPETAQFLTESERAWVVHRLRYQGSKDSGQMVAESEHFKWKYVREAFTDWQIYLGLWSASHFVSSDVHEGPLPQNCVLASPTLFLYSSGLGADA